MIPNAGLDNIAAYRPWGLSTGTGLAGSGVDSSGAQWLAYAAISEDSSAPAAGDTGIGTEKMRTNATGGFSRTTTAIRDAGTNRVGMSIERAYVFAITTGLNITKYGYVPLSTGGNFSWIDLTRADPNDPMSSPVTITLVDGDELQLWQTFTVTVPWSVDLESFVITGTAGNDAAGAHEAYCGFFAENDSWSTVANESNIATLISNAFWPVASGNFAWTQNATTDTTRDTRAATGGGVTGASSGVLADYVSGTFYRDKVFTLSTSEGNGDVTAIVVTAGSGLNSSPDSSHGFKIVFNDPKPFSKDHLHKLTLTFRVSWAEG